MKPNIATKPKTGKKLAHVRGPNGMTFSVQSDETGKFDKSLIASLQGRAPTSRASAT